MARLFFCALTNSKKKGSYKMELPRGPPPPQHNRKNGSSTHVSKKTFNFASKDATVMRLLFSKLAVGLFHLANNEYLQRPFLRSRAFLKRTSRTKVPHVRLRQYEPARLTPAESPPQAQPLHVRMNRRRAAESAPVSTVCSLASASIPRGPPSWNSPPAAAIVLQGRNV